MTEDDPLLIPLPPAYRTMATLEMIVPQHDFGPGIGVHDAIPIRELWLLMNISDEKMQEIDQARADKGLAPMFGDP